MTVAIVDYGSGNLRSVAKALERVTAEAGVSKTTFYKHFDSLTDLMVEAVRRRDAWEAEAWDRAVRERVGDEPRARLRGHFEVMDDWFQDPDFGGCMFINAVGEYSAADTPIRQACKDFKKLMRGYIVGLCRELPVPDPETLADEIAILLEGAIVTAQVSQASVHAAQVAKTAANTLIDQAMDAGGSAPDKTNVSA